MPSVLATEGLHPQRENAENAAAAAIPVPVAVAAEPGLAKVAKAEPKAVRVEGIGARPATVERSAFAPALEVGQDEAGEKGGRAERGEVVLRQLVLFPELHERLGLLLGVLWRSHDAGNEENQGVGGRLVVAELPVLEVGPPVVTRPGFRSVLLESEACLDRSDHRTVVTEVRGELAPLGDHGGELGRHVRVVDDGEEGAVRLLNKEAVKSPDNLLPVPIVSQHHLLGVRQR